MTRRIAVEIGDATATYCGDCRYLCMNVKPPICFHFMAKPLKRYNMTAERLPECLAAEIREEVKP
jgi:hypothetical protein